MIDSHSTSSTYILHIISENLSDESKKPIFGIKNLESRRYEEYSTIHALISGLLKSENLAGLPSGDGATGNENSFQKVAILKELLIASHNQLQQLHFLMTDRVASAQTYFKMIQDKKEGELSEIETKWFNNGLDDIEKLSEALGQWREWDALIEGTPLDDPQAVEQTVNSVIQLGL